MSSRDVDAEVLDAADNALVRKRLWGTVTESDEDAAVATVFAAVDEGMTPEIVDFLVAGLYVDDDELFTGFITWTADVLAARGVPAESLFPALDNLGKQLHISATSALAGEMGPASDPT